MAKNAQDMSKDEVMAAVKADEPKAEVKAKKPAEPAKVYFRCKTFIALRVPSGSGTDMQTRYERFAPYQHFNKSLGETDRFGLLATSNKLVIEACRGDANVEELSKSDYEGILESPSVSRARIR